jgi:hypothetical protein
MIARTILGSRDARREQGEAARFAGARLAGGTGEAGRSDAGAPDGLRRDEGGECPADCPLRRPWCP